MNFVFGFLTCVGGIAGVGIGSMLSEVSISRHQCANYVRSESIQSSVKFQMLRNGWGPFRYVQTVRSDAIICGIGAVIGVPMLYFSIHEIPYNMTVCWASIAGLVFCILY